MNLNLKRSLLIMLVLLLASILLAPFGLGWVPGLVGLALIGYSVYSMARGTSLLSEATEHPSGGEGEDDPQERRFAARMRGQRRGEDEALRRRKAREWAQQEADCGLTHDERVRFESIVQNMDGDPRH